MVLTKIMNRAKFLTGIWMAGSSRFRTGFENPNIMNQNESSQEDHQSYFTAEEISNRQDTHSIKSPIKIKTNLMEFVIGSADCPTYEENHSLPADTILQKCEGFKLFFF